MTQPRKPTGLEFLWGLRDFPEFQEYQRLGGGFGYEQWKREGKPAPPTGISARARGILEKTGGVPSGVSPAPREPSLASRMAAFAPEREARDIDLVPKDDIGDKGLATARTRLQGLEETNPGMFRLSPPNAQIPEWHIERTPQAAPQAGISPFQQAQLDAQQAQQEEQVRQFGLQHQLRAQEAGPQPISPFQEQQFGLQQQQLQFQQDQAQLQADFQRQQEMARLSANPINWLQYAAFTGEEARVQPWMIPLGFQQFGGDQGGGTTPQIAPQGTPPQGQATTLGGQQLQIGQPLLPQGGTDFTQLQGQFRTPSAQLQARWGPTAQGQFLGLQRAATGASPQETQFRLGSQRAPTGRFGGFTGFR